MNNKIILKKGASIKYLGYTIKNSLNNDGIVLSKENGSSYEYHLGNYGEGTKENIDFCKKDALIYFMLARPEHFANTLCRKIRKINSGTYREYYLLKSVLEKEGFVMPKEITAGDGRNSMIYFNGKPFTNFAVKEFA
jgi:hypothetical protein